MQNESDDRHEYHHFCSNIPEWECLESFYEGCYATIAYFGKYVAHNNDTVYMNYRDAGYFRILGFVAGDTVHIVEES